MLNASSLTDVRLTFVSPKVKKLIDRLAEAANQEAFDTETAMEESDTGDVEKPAGDCHALLTTLSATAQVQFYTSLVKKLNLGAKPGGKGKQSVATASASVQKKRKANVEEYEDNEGEFEVREAHPISTVDLRFLLLTLEGLADQEVACEGVGPAEDY